MTWNVHVRGKCAVLVRHTSNTRHTRRHTVTQFGRNRGSEVHLGLAGAIWNRNTISRVQFGSRTVQKIKLKLYFDEKLLWLAIRNTIWFPNGP